MGGGYCEVEVSDSFLVLAVGDGSEKDTWLIDSGCNVHLVNDKKWFITFKEGND